MIFIENKYTHWYYNIVNNATSRIIEGYTENHHIIPKSFYISKSKTGWLTGNSEAVENKVMLTAKEHLIDSIIIYVKKIQGFNL